MKRYRNFYGYDLETGLGKLVGAKVLGVEVSEPVQPEQVDLITDKGTFSFVHLQDCCESVYLNDVDGDLESLIGGTITSAEEESYSGYDGKWNEGSEDAPADIQPSEWESSTWTFYKLSTEKVSLTMRWVGSSNGYYSERVSVLLDPDV